MIHAESERTRPDGLPSSDSLAARTSSPSHAGWKSVLPGRFGRLARQPAVREFACWLLVAWMILVSASYLYFMVRSFF